MTFYCLSEFWKVDFCPFFGKITRSVHTFLNKENILAAASFSLLIREAAKHLFKRKTHDVNFKNAQNTSY